MSTAFGVKPHARAALVMGHRSIVMTMRYSHLAPAHQAAAVEKLVKPTATTTATEAVSIQ